MAKNYVKLPCRLLRKSIRGKLLKLVNQKVTRQVSNSELSLSLILTVLNYSEGVDGAIKRVCLYIATTTLLCTVLPNMLQKSSLCLISVTTLCGRANNIKYITGLALIIIT